MLGTDIDVSPASLGVTITLPDPIVNAGFYTYDAQWKLHPTALPIRSHRVSVMAQDKLSVLRLISGCFCTHRGAYQTPGEQTLNADFTITNDVTDLGNGIINVAIDLAVGQAEQGHRVVIASAGGGHDHRCTSSKSAISLSIRRVVRCRS